MLLTLLLTLALQAPTLKISPNYAPEPATITMTVTNIAGPVVCVGLVGLDYTRSSCEETQGRKIVQFVYDRVPYGEYVALAATCSGAQSSECSPTQPLKVIVTETGDPR